MFMNTSERLLLMDLHKVNNQMMTEDELKALFDAGIHTAQLCYVYWHEIEKEEGQYDWSRTDERIETLNRIGYKVMPMCYTEPAQYFSDDYYINDGTNYLRGVLSPWNKNAQQASLNFMKIMTDRYNSSTCMVINGCLVMGETPFSHGRNWYDPEAIKSFQNRWATTDMPVMNENRTETWMKETIVAMKLAENKVLAENQWNEIWSMIHPEIAMQAGLYGNGCNFIDDIYTAYKTEIPNVQINQIWYTFVQHTRQYETYTRLINQYNMNAFGGAEYCEGLEENGPKALRLGFKGLIIHPLHPFTNHETLQPWMIEKIKKSIIIMNN